MSFCWAAVNPVFEQVNEVTYISNSVCVQVFASSSADSTKNRVKALLWRTAQNCVSTTSVHSIHNKKLTTLSMAYLFLVPKASSGDIIENDDQSVVVVSLEMDGAAEVGWYRGSSRFWRVQSCNCNRS